MLPPDRSRRGLKARVSGDACSVTAAELGDGFRRTPWPRERPQRGHVQKLLSERIIASFVTPQAKTPRPHDDCVAIDAKCGDGPTDAPGRVLGGVQTGQRPQSRQEDCDKEVTEQAG